MREIISIIPYGSTMERRIGEKKETRGKKVDGVGMVWKCDETEFNE